MRRTLSLDRSSPPFPGRYGEGFFLLWSQVDYLLAILRVLMSPLHRQSMYPKGYCLSIVYTLMDLTLYSNIHLILDRCFQSKKLPVGSSCCPISQFMFSLILLHTHISLCFRLEISIFPSYIVICELYSLVFFFLQMSFLKCYTK